MGRIPKRLALAGLAAALLGAASLYPAPRALRPASPVADAGTAAPAAIAGTPAPAAVPGTAGPARSPRHRRRRAGPRRRTGQRHRAPRHGRRRRAPSPAPSPRVDLNRADAATLARAGGLGDRLAQRIVMFRELNGRFESLDDLEDVDGLSTRRIQSLERSVFVR